MKPRGFTLIEISIACLICSILLYGVFAIFSATMHRFSHQESYVTCTWQANLIISYLQQDLEDAVFADEIALPEQIEKITQNASDTLLIPATKESFAYKFDNQSGILVRTAGTQNIRLGNNLVKNFSCQPFLQTDDGKIYGKLSEIEPEKTKPPQLKRLWFKVELWLKDDTNSQVKEEQKYSFFIFPVRLNRQLQSIWKIN